MKIDTRCSRIVLLRRDFTLQKSGKPDTSSTGRRVELGLAPRVYLRPQWVENACCQANGERGKSGLWKFLRAEMWILWILRRYSINMALLTITEI